MLKKLELYSVNILFFIFSIYILILNIFMLSVKNFISILLFIPLLFCFYFLVKKILSIHDENKVRKISIVLLIALFFILFGVGYVLRVALNWDYGSIQRVAIYFGQTGKIDMQRVLYFAKCPNNRLIVILIMLIYRLMNILFGIKDVASFRVISIFVNCIFIEASYVFTYMLAKKIKGEKFAFLTLVSLILMLPVILYSAIFYTDTVGMAFIPLVLLLYLRFRECKKLKYLIIFSVISLIGFEIKATVIFILAAIFFDILCSENFFSACRYIGLSFVIIVLCYLGFNIGMYKFLGITSEDSNKYELPHTHHIMMALNPDYEGGYNEKDVLYTMSFKTKKEKTNANINMIKSRLNDYGVGGSLNRFFYVKWVRTWTDPTFASSDYLSRDPVKNSFLTQIVTREGNKYHYYLSYMWIYWIIVIVGLLLSVIFYKKDVNIILVSKVLILLFALFLSFWECNPRYVVHILPSIMLISIFGYYCLYEKRNKKCESG